MNRWIAGTGLVLALVAAGWIYAVGYGADITLAALMTLVTVTIWATGALPMHIMALLFMTVTVLLPGGGPDIAFAGFSTSAFWLVFGGLVLGAGMQETGLGKRIATSIVPHLPKSYAGLIFVVAGVSSALGFFVPAAMARIVILIPMIKLIGDQLSFDDPPRGQNGLLITGILATTLPPFTILTGNLPTILVYGAAESLYAIDISYLDYLVAQFPALGLPQTLLIGGFCALAFKTGMRTRTSHENEVESTPLTAGECWLAIILLGALLLWLTDRWHGISPGWVAMMAATIALLPVTGIYKPADFKSKIEYGAVFYTAGIIALVSFVAASGLAGVMRDAITTAFSFTPGDALGGYLKILFACVVITLTGTHPTVSATLVPVADAIALDAGLSIDSVLLILTAGFPLVIAPYQVAPLAVGMAMAMIPAGTAVRSLASITVLTAVLILPLHFFWLRLLGVL